ncbi:ParM/StbA family protein [Clostridium perfringens]|uniref:ParM/StbA family protein n=1 Tax=Clostridium perfringens TaxID=1502 RepID=UPI0024BD2CBA|nr:ParM/StbA family protein [Clostridium perfringens]
MLKLGIDLGNGYTKFKGSKFASKTKVGRLASLAGLGEKPKDIHEVGYKGTTYIVGDGEVFTSPDRYFGLDYEICLLTAIGLSSKDIVIDSNICVGLPIIYFMSETKVLLEKKLNELTEKDSIKITINGQDKIIKINNARVFAEGAYVLDCMDTDNIITIDLGAGTVNITQWDNLIPISYDTITKSFNKLYRDIANHIKNTGRGVVTPAYIEANFGEDTITIDGKVVDITDTKQMISKYVSAIVSNVYDICDVPQANKIQIFGGGAIATEEYWKDAFGKDRDGVSVLPNSQYTNSKIYQKAAEILK